MCNHEECKTLNAVRDRVAALLHGKTLAEGLSILAEVAAAGITSRNHGAQARAGAKFFVTAFAAVMGEFDPTVLVATDAEADNTLRTMNVNGLPN